MKIGFVLWLLLSTATLAQTNTTLAVDGVTYSNVVFGTVTPVTVTITHSKGVESLPLEKLPAEFQRQFGYDPEKAKAWRIKEQQAADVLRQRQAQKRAEAQKREAARAVLLENCKMAEDLFGHVGEVATNFVVLRVGTTEIALLGHPKASVLLTDQSVKCKAYKDGVFREPGTGRAFERWVYCSDN